jgi:type II secretory pathway pseudopilin PulG
MAKSSCHILRARMEKGYVLLTLLLFVSLLVIAAAATAPAIARQLNRDREEELIHRGIEYRRAIHAYVKRTGQFPLSLDQLENTNGTRYLRKRYKDPITGGDFQLLHTSDIAAPAPTLTAAGPPPDGTASTATTDQSLPSSPSTDPASVSLSQNTQSKPGNGSALQSAFSSNSSAGGNNVGGGGLILGVASRSAKQTIREFDHKNHYNQWLFFYSANYDGSVEVKGPTPQKPIFAAPKNSSDSSSPGTQPALSQPQP